MRNGLGGMWRFVKRQELLQQAAKAQVLQRELVQKSLHQLHEYNHHEYGAFVKPIVMLNKFEANWENWTAESCEEERQDLVQAKETIKHYEKIYAIFEHSTDLS